MQISIRLLTPDKKGIARRISAAVLAAGGKVEDMRTTRRLRGMSETTLLASLAHDRLKKPILDALGEVAGVAILSILDLPTA